MTFITLSEILFTIKFIFSDDLLNPFPHKFLTESQAKQTDCMAQVNRRARHGKEPKNNRYMDYIQWFSVHVEGNETLTLFKSNLPHI